MVTRFASRLALVWLACALATSCKRRVQLEERDDDEDQEERETSRDNFWRVQIAIVGQGRVATTAPGFDCVSDGTTQGGDCGPRLVRFDERHPPLLRATGAPGWRFDHWESQTRAASGAITRRQGRMPDGRLYLNGFGYSDTGALETVFALFEPVILGPDDLEDDRGAGAR